MGILKRIRYSPYSPTLLKNRLFRNIPYPETTIKWYLNIHRLRPSQSFSDHDPFKTHWIDPNKITNVSSNGRPVLWSSVEDGTWDQDTELFTSRPVYIALEQRYKHDVPWEETPLVSEFESNARFGDAWGYTTPEDFEKRVQEIEQLVDSIKNNGYRTQSELDSDDQASSNDPVPPILNEVTIDISRDGEPLWRDFGQHRLAIAKIFELSEIPVLIATRHEKWVSSIKKPCLSKYN